MGTIAYLSLGSNLGDRFQNLTQAITEINRSAGEVQQVSSIYITPPWGFEAELDFFNCCVSICTNQSLRKLLETLQEIEQKLGRVSSNQTGYASRPIDIDIVSFGEVISDNETLTIPHPRMEERRFVLHPLQEISPDFIHSVSKKTIQQLIAECADDSMLTISEQKISWNC